MRTPKFTVTEKVLAIFIVTAVLTRIGMHQFPPESFDVGFGILVPMVCTVCAGFFWNVVKLYEHDRKNAISVLNTAGGVIMIVGFTGVAVIIGYMGFVAEIPLLLSALVCAVLSLVGAVLMIKPTKRTTNLTQSLA